MTAGRSGAWRLAAASLAVLLAGLACARGGILPANTPAPTQTATATVRAADPSPTVAPTVSPSPSASPSPTPTPEPTATEVPTANLQLQPEAAAQAYVVPLTVQHLTPQSALLFFRLDGPSPGYVIYRKLPASSSTWLLHPMDSANDTHQIRLDGLEPDTRYEIQAVLGEALTELRAPRLQGKRWGPLAVRTPPSGEPSLRIGVIGDTGFGEELTQALVARMAQLNLDLVLHTGDLMYRPEQEGDPPLSYALKFFLPFQPLLVRMPVYAVPGNHDLDPPTRWSGELFYHLAFPGFVDPALGEDNAQPGRGWYAFSYGSWQFLMLNSQVFHGQPGRLEHTAWLRQRLADPAFAASIAVLHVPPFSSGRYGDDGRASRVDWVPLFEQAAVPLVLAGHDHNYQRLLFNGITYVISGGGSSVLYPQSQELSASQSFARRSHFVLVEIGQSRIELTAIGEQGEVFDRAQIEAVR